MGEKETVLYYATTTKTSHKIEDWLVANGVTYRKQNVRHELFTRKEIKDLLLTTSGGFEEIISLRSGKYQLVKDEFNELTFNDALDYLYENQELIKLPILKQGHKIMFGYRDETISSFTPRQVKQRIFTLTTLITNDTYKDTVGA